MRIRIVHIRKNGNSLGINFPADVLRELGLREGDRMGLQTSTNLIVLARLSDNELAKAMVEEAAKKEAV